MKSKSYWLTTYLIAIFSTITVTSFAQQNENKKDDSGWSNTAEFTIVFTGGNAEASTFGIQNELIRTWENTALLIDISALRAESTQIKHIVIGSSPNNFQVRKESIKTTTAENYHARGRYDRNINTQIFWYAGTSWERNTFIGINNRYSWVGGIGNNWLDNDQTIFQTAYGISYTLQDDVAQVLENKNIFAGLRLSYDYRWKINPSTELTSMLFADENLNEFSDFRADLTNAVIVNMSSKLALKLSWQLLYDNLPSSIMIPLVNNTGVITDETVFIKLENFDNLLTFALVATF